MPTLPKNPSGSLSCRRLRSALRVAGAALTAFVLTGEAGFAAEPGPAGPFKATVVAGHSEPNVKPGELNVPFGVASDGQENLFVVEFDGGRLFRLTADGLRKVAGTGEEGFAGDGGPAVDAVFHGMHGLAVNRAGDVFLADTHNHVVRKIDAKTQVVSRIVGDGKKGYAGDGGPALAAQFNGIFAIDLPRYGEEEVLLVTDLFNRRVRKVDLKTGTVSLVAGNGQKGKPKDGGKAVENPLADPRAAAGDSQGNVYILERGGNALRAAKADGTIHTVAGTGKVGKQDGPGLESSFNGPKHLCVDLDDAVWIADAENHLVRRYDPKTQTVQTLTFDPPLQLNRPHGVFVDRKGKLFIVDSYFHRVLAIDRPAVATPKNGG